MVHLSLSQTFLVLVSEPAVSLQPAFTLSPLLSPPPQHLAGLQPTIILAHIRARTGRRAVAHRLASHACHVDAVRGGRHVSSEFAVSIAVGYCQKFTTFPIA